MARYVARVHTPLPVEEAFAFMADLTNFARWDPGVVDARQVVGDEPEHGAEYDVEVRGPLRPLTLRYRLSTHRPPDAVVAEASTRRLTSIDRITVEPGDDGGSVVTYDANLVVNGAPRFAEPLVRAVFNRIGRRAERGLVEALRGRAMQGTDT
jgi:hypothetical protein